MTVVRSMSCLYNEGLCSELLAMGRRAEDERATADLFTRWCRGPVQAVHVTARAGGDIVHLCAYHRRDVEKRGGVLEAAGFAEARRR